MEKSPHPRPDTYYTGADLDFLWSSLLRRRHHLEAFLTRMRPRLRRLEALLAAAPSPTRCPPGCGECCERDVGVFTLPEFLLVVEQILHGRVPEPLPDPTRRRCLFWRIGMDCSVYPCRPLLCRYFGVAETRPLLGSCPEIRPAGPLPAWAVPPLEAFEKLDRIAGTAGPRPLEDLLEGLKTPAYWIAVLLVGAGHAAGNLLDAGAGWGVY